ncbi:hypothetical protein BGX27_004944 [Mortierella sp. AM989]|nr:hypothetical protein BGX27_004944 [Mortierella sp. AM989]
MSATEDDRKQRFRFHKNDEILLLEIVLRANPCPYKISSRDGAIMVAWNSIAEEFHRLCKPRPDGKLPHPRTCRTRCDKMIMDYMAMRGSPHLRNKRQESKEDRAKNELLSKLASIQGKVLDQTLGDIGDDDDGIDMSGVGNDDNSASVGGFDTAGSRSGTGANLVTPGHLLAHGATAGSSAINNTQLHHHSQQQQQQQHNRSSVSSTLTPQSLAILGNDGHRMVHNQSTSELLAASRLLLSTPGIPGIQSGHHQDTSDILSITSTGTRPRVDRSKQQNASAGARKRRGNNLTDMSTTGSASAPSQHDLNSLDYMDRSNPNSAAGQTHHAGMLPNIAKRLKPASGKHVASNVANTFAQQNNGHHSNHARSLTGAIGGLGSNLSGPDLTGLNVSGIAEVSDDDDDDEDEAEDEDDDEDGDNGAGFQDAREELGNDFDDDFGNDDDVDDGNIQDSQQLDSSSILSFQNSPTMANRNDGRQRGGATMRGSVSSNIPALASNTKGRSKRKNNELQRHPSNNSVGGIIKAGLSPLGSAIGSGFPSQMGAEDRKYLLRTLQLEEKKVQVQMDKIELERDRLQLERERLQWDMRKMNQM